MKKLGLIYIVIFICVGLMIFSGGFLQSPVAFCQVEEEEEPIQTRPRPDIRPNPMQKQGIKTQKENMGPASVINKQKMVEDDGEHGDGRQTSMKQTTTNLRKRPGRVKQQMKMRQTVPNR